MRVYWAITWKEWLGLKWKLAALSAILLVSAMIVLVFDPAFFPTSLVTLVIAYAAIAPIFLAMHAAAEDNSSGTLEFVRGLPISLPQLGFVRLFATLAVLLAPLVATGALTSLFVALLKWWRPDTVFMAFDSEHGVTSGIVVVIVTGMTVSASLFLWTTALAMNSSSELRAGLIGVVTAVVWGIWTIHTLANYTMARADHGAENWTWVYGITALGPFGGSVLFDPGLTTAVRVAMATIQLASMIALTVIAAQRYGILERPSRTNRFRPSGPESALWWLQWQQVWPVGAAGLAAVLGFAALGTAFSPNAWNNSRDDLYRFSIGVGAVWAIVIAAPLFSADLEPRLVTFWRSRPIDPAAWFRIKYLAGALALVIFIDLPVSGPGLFLGSSQSAQAVAYLACVPAFHLAVYSLAVLIACLVRHTIYAGILSLGAAMFIVILPAFVPRREILTALNVKHVMQGLTDTIDAGLFDVKLLYLAIYLTFMLTVAATTVGVARWAVQKDLAVRA